MAEGVGLSFMDLGYDIRLEENFSTDSPRLGIATLHNPSLHF